MKAKCVKNNLPLAICFSILAWGAFAIQTICVKFALPTTPFSIIVFFRFFLCFLVLVVLAAPHNIIKVAKTNSLKLTLLRGVLSVAAISCTFYAIHFIPVATSILLSGIDPLLIPLVFWIGMRTKIIASLYWGIIIGFIGIILILHPSGGFFQFGALFAVAAGLLRSITYPTLRILAKKDSTQTIMFNFFFIGSLSSALFSIGSWHGMMHWGWLPIIGISLSTLLFQWFNTLTLTYGPARIMSSFNYLAVVFSAIADYFIWGQTLSSLTILGMVLVIAGSILTTLIGRAKIK